MQQLGLSDSTTRTEGRLKALLWPAISNEGDLDYVTQQGFWICFVVAVITAVSSAFSGFLLSALPEIAFFFLAGMGVRERSRAAAVAAFGTYLLGSGVMLRVAAPAPNGIIIRVVFLALLLANVRGIWVSARWPADEAKYRPERLNQTIGDKLSDQLPRLLWPKLRWAFWILAVMYTVMLILIMTVAAPAAV